LLLSQDFLSCSAPFLWGRTGEVLKDVVQDRWPSIAGSRVLFFFSCLQVSFPRTSRQAVWRRLKRLNQMRSSKMQ
jgi:hypothetical protein